MTCSDVTIFFFQHTNSYNQLCVYLNFIFLIYIKNVISILSLKFICAHKVSLKSRIFTHETKIFLAPIHFAKYTFVIFLQLVFCVSFVDRRFAAATVVTS